MASKAWQQIYPLANGAEDRRTIDGYVAPDPRTEFGMVIDQYDNIFVFGGLVPGVTWGSNDLWHYNTRTHSGWTLVLPRGGPDSGPMRNAFGFDLLRNESKIVLYGGFFPENRDEIRNQWYNRHNDVWEYSYDPFNPTVPGKWVQVQPDVVHTGRNLWETMEQTDILGNPIKTSQPGFFITPTGQLYTLGGLPGYGNTWCRGECTCPPNTFHMNLTTGTCSACPEGYVEYDPN